MQFANKRLTRWGQWRNRTLTGSLKYSSKNILHAVISLGCTVQRGNIQEDWSDSISEEVDAILNWLNHILPITARVLREHYTQPGTMEIHGARLGLPKSTYHDHLQRGKRKVAYELQHGKPSLRVIPEKSFNYFRGNSCI